MLLVKNRLWLWLQRGPDITTFGFVTDLGAGKHPGPLCIENKWSPLCDL